MAWKHTAYHINKSHPGHAPKAAIKEKDTVAIAILLLKHHQEGGRENNFKKYKGNFEVFCFTLKRNKKQQEWKK